MIDHNDTARRDPDDAAGQVQLAERIATRAHAGQVDKAGRTYLDHPRRVAARLDEPVAQAAAWLHDVIEDTEVDAAKLLDEGVWPQIVRAVEALTRNPSDRDPEQYYARVAADPLALVVKWADLADNTDPERLAELPVATRDRLIAKYAHARELLHRLAG